MMVDVKNVKKKVIPLEIDGVTRYVKGANKYTTCGDVIKMVLKQTGIGKSYSHMYVICEISKEGETALPNRIGIRKWLKACGNEPNRLVMKKVKPICLSPSSNENHKQPCHKNKIKHQDVDCGISRESYVQTTISGPNCVHKQAKTMHKHLMSYKNSSLRSNSDSDNSNNDLSEQNQSKISNLITFFNALTVKKHKPVSRRSKQSQNSTESDNTSDFSLKELTKRRNSLKRMHGVMRRTSRIYRNYVHEGTNDIHPNKINRLNCDHTTVIPSLQDEVYSSERQHKSVDSHRKASRRHMLAKKRITQNRPGREMFDKVRPCSDTLTPGENNTRIRKGNTSAEVGMCLKMRTNSENFNGHFFHDVRSIQADFNNDDAAENILHANKPFVLENKSRFSMYTLGFQHNVSCGSDYEIAVRNKALISSNGTNDNLTKIDNSEKCKCRTFKGNERDSLYIDNIQHLSPIRRLDNSQKPLGYDQESNDSGNSSEGCTDNLNGYIKHIFDMKCSGNEDDEIDSFMHSRVWNNSTDEDLSSVESGIETRFRL